MENWRVRIPAGEDRLCYAGENQTARLEIRLAGAYSGDWSWTWEVSGPGNYCNIIALRRDGEALKADILASYGLPQGTLHGQIVAKNGDGAVKKSNIFYLTVEPAVNAPGQYPPQVPSAMEQALSELEELSAHPPCPGENGYWMTWDLDAHGYAESDIPLPEVDVGPPGPPGAAATVTVGTTATGEPGTQAQVTNSGTGSAAVLDFVVPRGAAGAQGPQGPAGPEGPAGPQGPKGDTGETGPQGADGRQGPAGQDGEDGGYYTPAVDAGGNLSWTASKSGMPPAAGGNIQGPQGPAGLGVPVPGAGDAGRVPVVNGEGTGYELQEMSGSGGAWTLVQDITFEADTQDVIWENTAGHTEFILLFENLSNTTSGYFKRLYCNNTNTGGPGVGLPMLFEWYLSFTGNGSKYRIWVSPLGGDFYGANMQMAATGGAYSITDNCAREDVRDTPYLVFYNQGNFHTGDTLKIYGR